LGQEASVTWIGGFGLSCIGVITEVISAPTELRSVDATSASLTLAGSDR